MTTTTAEYCYKIYHSAILDYHIQDDTRAPSRNPYPEGTLEHLFYKKNWIDTVQWHLEDMIRDPDLDDRSVASLKREIDKWNQKRTDTVEIIDDYFIHKYQQVTFEKNARHNTETLGWSFDRLSILSLREFHLNLELKRKDSPADHREKCLARSRILLDQKTDLIAAIDWLIVDIENGRKRIKVYRQLKMYNDPTLNPVLYNKYKYYENSSKLVESPSQQDRENKSLDHQ
jgi:hypothetical protein